MRDEWTFAMLDIAGFTALTEAHGDDQAADLAVGFATLIADLLTPADQVVKTIGDAVLVASQNSSASLRLLRNVLCATYEEQSFPVVRVGVHHGPAVRRAGDFFGGAVNLSARVAAEAAGGQVLATGRVATAARDGGRAIRPLGPRRLKNVADPVELWEVDLHVFPAERSIDPVCRMLVEHSRCAGQLVHRDTQYWFCSLTCAGMFAASPDRYNSA